MLDNLQSLSVPERQKKIVEHFAEFADWEDRYREIIQIGKQLEDLPEAEKLEKYKVKGCQSQVWLLADLTPEGKIHYRADSDAMIVRGLVSILLNVFSDAPPTQIASASTDFLKDAGFAGHLSPNRTNGLYSMVEQIKLYAVALQALAKAKGLA